MVIDVVANSGPYNEWVQFNDISGSSSTNTITLNGNSNTVSYSGTSTRSPVITFSSTDHFILDNLVIENKGNSYGRCVQIRSVSTYVTISNCQLNMPNLTSTTAENTYLLIGNASSNSSVSSFSNAGEYCTITGNTTSGPSIGGPKYGISIIDKRPNTDNKYNTVHNNEITNFLNLGIYFSHGDEGSVITNNKIH